MDRSTAATGRVGRPLRLVHGQGSKEGQRPSDKNATERNVSQRCIWPMLVVRKAPAPGGGRGPVTNGAAEPRKWPAAVTH